MEGVKDIILHNDNIKSCIATLMFEETDIPAYTPCTANFSPYKLQDTNGDILNISHISDTAGGVLNNMESQGGDVILCGEVAMEDRQSPSSIQLPQQAQPIYTTSETATTLLESQRPATPPP